MTDVSISTHKIAQYLNIALKQRERALTKFISDYGPTSSVVQETNTEISDMRRAIDELMRTPTPIEQKITENITNIKNK